MDMVDDTELIGKMLHVSLKMGKAPAFGGEYKGILKLGSSEFIRLAWKSEKEEFENFIPLENIAWIGPMNEKKKT
jgi:hypothetical protein